MVEIIFNCIIYADDTALIANSREKLQLFIERLVEASERNGLKLNASKSKVMIVSKSKVVVSVNLRLKRENLERVERLKCRGSYTTRLRRCEDQIRAMIHIAKDAFQKVRCLVTYTAFSLTLRSER